MALSEIKAPQTAAFSDAAVSVEPGDVLCIFTDDAGGLLPHEVVDFYYDTPNQDLLAFSLTGVSNAKALTGAADLIGKKRLTTVKVGIAKKAKA